ncbi:hypothetical protein B0H14DRAFT_2632237 [Mycena olivaceomarginata]|nr:hypothetical protein B0H14DRAFT_2632237 [Mycena olivaceomarginata]
MIVRKFTNYRNCVYRKSATAIPTSALANEKANPLLKFSSITSGCQLFAKDHSESITATSRRRLLDTEIRPSKEPIPSAILRHSVLLGWNHCRPAIDHQAQQFTPSPIVDDTELSESPSPPLCSPALLPTPPSRQKGVKRKAKKQPERRTTRTTALSTKSNSGVKARESRPGWSLWFAFALDVHSLSFFAILTSIEQCSASLEYLASLSLQAQPFT